MCRDHHNSQERTSCTTDWFIPFVKYLSAVREDNADKQESVSLVNLRRASFLKRAISTSDFTTTHYNTESRQLRVVIVKFYVLPPGWLADYSVHYLIPRSQHFNADFEFNFHSRCHLWSSLKCCLIYLLLCPLLSVWPRANTRSKCSNSPTKICNVHH